MHSGPTTDRILIAFVLPTNTEGFFTIILAEYPVPESDRRFSGPLRDLLLDSFQPGTVEWDCKLESAEMQGEQVLLRFAGGKTALADLAIGSDGANSRLRELVTSIRPTYVGVSLVESHVPDAKRTIPELWDLLDGSALIGLGGERTMGMGTKP